MATSEVTKRRVNKREPLSDGELIAILEDRESRADSARPDAEYYGDALSYYMGDYGEAPARDRSSLVMMELLSTIEWIKPILAKIFFGGPRVLKFMPRKAGDEDQAQQETDYVSHVISERNEGFSVITDWFADAMLSRNAYVLAYWEEKEDTTENRFDGQTYEQLEMIVNEPDTEVVDGPYEDEDGLFSISVRTNKKTGQVKIDNIPPERVRIDSKHRKLTLQDCPFVEYYEERTISELREMGFDVDDDINDDDQDQGFARSVEHIRRGADQTVDDDDDMDPASREVIVRTAWLRVDADGDGIAELRRMIVVGNTILYNEPDDLIGVCAISPLRIPHRHTGLSLYDLLKQVQDLKTQLARGMVDNVHLANNGRWFLSDRVDVEDFLNTSPVSPVRVEGDTVAGAAESFQHPMLGSQIIGMLEYTDSLSENWTGVSPRSLQGQTFDGNSINKTASGLSQIMSAALSRVEMMARIFAESGVKELFMVVHTLTLQNARKQEVFELRGEWIEVNPSNWEKRSGMKVSSGLGTGDQQQRVAVLQQLIQSMMSMLQLGAPITDWNKIYNAFVMLTHEMGYLDDSQFWNDPAKAQEQPKGIEGLHPEQRTAVMEQIQQMVEGQLKQRQDEIKQEGEARGIEADLTKAVMDNETKLSIENSRVMAELLKSMGKNDHDAAMQGVEVSDGPGVSKRVEHVYDDEGRVVESRLISEG